ncbi:MAG: hypothetical protein AABX33_01850 [Nanoarchaeota archaeon]
MIVEQIKNNINWIKDIFTLIFAVVGTIIAILTYKRAKATILQPIRTEVIKKQSLLLSELLSFLGERQKFETIDLYYEDIIKLSIIGFLIKHRLLTENVDEHLKYFKENFYFGDVSKQGGIEEMGLYFSYPKIVKSKNFIDNIYETLSEIKKSKIQVKDILYPKKYFAIELKIREFLDNPFMPEKIRQSLKKLNKEISDNNNIHLTFVIQHFLINFAKKYLHDKKMPHIQYTEIYNHFNRHAISPLKTIDELRNEVRNYLRIDEKW